jgi:hypothetical protein
MMEHEPDPDPYPTPHAHPEPPRFSAGRVACPVCGAHNDARALICAVCGAALPPGLPRLDDEYREAP